MIIQKNVKQTVAAPETENPNEIKFKFLSDSVLKAFERDGRKYCRLTASSGGEDLVGDIMSQKALEQMKSAALGTVMFMNHSTNVPEDVFGTVIEATLEKKKVELTGGGEGELYCLDYLVEVQDDNERAVKTWQMIEKGTKLGASVTVLVRDKSPNPKRNKGIVIEDVESLETSIVGIPCNRQSWVNSAKKALELAERRAAKNQPAEAEDIPPENENGETEKTMSKPEVKTAAGLVAPNSGKQIAVVGDELETRKFFARTLSAIEVAKTVREQIEAKGENIEIPQVVPKGMFNEILAQEQSLWDLIDILYEVKWTLMSQKWNLEYLGQTDFSEILAAWSEALDEFKEAAIVSFKFWGDFGDADELVSNALKIEKTLTGLAEVYEKFPAEDSRTTVREMGTKLLEIAKQIGVVMVEKDSEALENPETPEGELQIPQPADEAIENSAKFVELKQLAVKAETEKAELQKKLDEAEENLEIAKAGLKAANAVIGANLRRPLAVATEGTPATS